MQPLRRLLLKELLVLFGLLACVSAGLAWIGINRILDQQIEARAREDLNKLARDIRRDLVDIERVGRTAARWWEEGKLPAQSLPSAEQQLAALLEEFPSVANLVLISVDGWGLSMSRLPDGLSSYHLDARKEEAQKRFLRQGGKPLVSTYWEDTPYRVFQRPWFQTASQTHGPQWVGAYRFVNRPTHGISFAIPLRDAQGQFRGALCTDIFLDALSERTWQVRPTPHSEALVSDSEGRALILPRGKAPEAIPTPEATYLSRLSPEFLPRFDALLKRWILLGRPSALFPLKHGGDRFTCIVHRLEGVEGVSWFLSLAVPDEDYRGGGRRVALVILAAGLLASFGGIWRVFRIAHRVSTPLEALAGSALALGKGAVPDPVSADIAELHTLGVALERAGQALEQEAQLQLKLQHSQRLETVGTLTGGIAHDVNNQLAAIVGQLNLGREYLDADHPATLRLSKAEEAAHRCARMIRSLLGFTHQAKPELVQLDLNEVVRHTTSLVERLLGGRIRLELDLSTQLPPVQGEAVSLEQVLMNLAVNARDAMPEGGLLQIQTSLIGKEVCLAVKDNGSGIPPEVLPKIFDPFFTTKAVGQGTGLGLAMVFSIVKAHEGRVEVASELGKGTEFKVLLHATEPEPMVAAPKPSPAFSTDFLVGRHILVVEDEAQLRDLLSETFTLRQAQVETATNGREGWERWQESAFDLVISDQRMPEMTGLELLAQIRASGSTVPIILASGYGLEGLESALANDPDLRFLPKPFTLQQLFRMAASALQHSED